MATTCLQSQAALTSYGSLTAFEAASTGLTTIDFEGLAAPGGFTSYDNSPLPLADVTVTSSGTMFVVDPGYYGFAYGGGAFLTSNYSSPDVVTITFATPVTAIALDFGGLFEEPTSFRFDFSDGSFANALTTRSVESSNPLDFIGFVSTAPITSLVLTMSDAPGYNAIDNLRFGSAALSVPEPSSLLLAGLGLLGVVAARRRRPA